MVGNRAERRVGETFATLVAVLLLLLALSVLLSGFYLVVYALLVVFQRMSSDGTPPRGALYASVVYDPVQNRILSYGGRGQVRMTNGLFNRELYFAYGRVGLSLAYCSILFSFLRFYLSINAMTA